MIHQSIYFVYILYSRVSLFCPQIEFSPSSSMKKGTSWIMHSKSRRILKQGIAICLSFRVFFGLKKLAEGAP